jgi:hypothetical protein
MHTIQMQPGISWSAKPRGAGNVGDQIEANYTEALAIAVERWRKMTLGKTCIGVAAWLLLAISGAATAQTSMSDAWRWRATLYGWLPSVHSTSDLNIGGGESINTDTNPSGYLSNLKFTVMGTLEARKGPWSFLGDAIYLNFGDLKSNLRSIKEPGGIIVVPVTANVRTDLKGFAGALEGGYSLIMTPTATWISSSERVICGSRLDSSGSLLDRWAACRRRGAWSSRKTSGMVS